MIVLFSCFFSWTDQTLIVYGKTNGAKISLMHLSSWVHNYLVMPRLKVIALIQLIKVTRWPQLSLRYVDKDGNNNNLLFCTHIGPYPILGVHECNYWKLDCVFHAEGTCFIIDGAASGVTKIRHGFSSVDVAQRKRSWTFYRIYPK
jgi:hypothetical protein